MQVASSKLDQSAAPVSTVIAPAPAETSLVDDRIRRLLGDAAWWRLPQAVRRRFSRPLGSDVCVIYRGEVTEMSFSRGGWLLANLARLVGGPLPWHRETGIPCIVAVTADGLRGGQFWTRIYARLGGRPQIIHSEKRFAGPTGLEKHVGFGFGVTLVVSATARSLLFSGDRYFVDIGRVRLWLPRWLSPGVMTVAHSEIDPRRFAFTLDLAGEWFGPLIHQRIEFEEAEFGVNGTAPLARRT